MIGVIKKCFSINLNDYEYINVDLEINKAVAVAFVALILGIFTMNIYRGNIRITVLQLIRHGANSEENAKTLAEIGLANSKMVKRLLSGNNLLTKTVTLVGKETPSYESYVKLSKEEKQKLDKINFETAKFYIGSEQNYMAEGIIEKYVTTFKRTVATCAFVSILCVCIIVIMPEILNLVNSLLKSVKM